MALWQYLRRWRSGRRDARRARASTASLPLQADHGSLARKRRRRWWALTVPVRHKACDTLTRARRRRQGRPIYIQHLGQINMKKMYEVTTEERMLKFHVQEYERCANYIMRLHGPSANYIMRRRAALVGACSQPSSGLHDSYRISRTCRQQLAQA